MIRRLRAVRRNKVLTTMLTGLAIALALFAFTLPAKAQQAEQPDKYLLRHGGSDSQGDNHSGMREI